MPTVSTGKPTVVENYLTETVDGLTIYYNPRVEMKPGHRAITVKLKKLLFLRWLELEGARAITVYEQE